MLFMCGLYGLLQVTHNIKYPFSYKIALRIMLLAPFYAHNAHLFKNCNILQYIDIINIKSCVFVNKCLKNNPFSIFTEIFKLASPT